MIVWFNTLPLTTQLLLLFLVGMNVITGILFAMDKAKAYAGKRRISEMTLWLFSFFGGSIGALVAMKIFRHKTQKVSFQAGIMVGIALQLFLLVYLFSDRL